MGGFLNKKSVQHWRFVLFYYPCLSSLLYCSVNISFKLCLKKKKWNCFSENAGHLTAVILKLFYSVFTLGLKVFLFKKDFFLTGIDFSSHWKIIFRKVILNQWKPVNIRKGEIHLNSQVQSSQGSNFIKQI